MKIIDLLNKLANDEIKNGTKIKRYGKTYIIDFPNLSGIYEENTEKYNETTNFFTTVQDICSLNDEVEIIEEEKEIEKRIEKIIISMDDYSMPYVTNNKYQKLSYSEVDLLFANKINELMDVINDMRDKE